MLFKNRQLLLYKHLLYCYTYVIIILNDSIEYIQNRKKVFIMEKAYKFRIYPNKTQENLLQKTFGCVRFIYNHFLDRRIKAYEQNKKTISYNECSKELTQLKKEKKWLKEPDKSSLQNALKHLDTAYKNFFREQNGFPCFHKKGVKDSYRTLNAVLLSKRFLRLPKVGPVKLSENIYKKKKIHSVTISKQAGKYYVSLLFDYSPYRINKEKNQVGIDVGIKDLAILSDRTVFENIKTTKKYEKRLSVLQRRLSKKCKGSKNREKAKLKVSRLYQKMANIRNDYLNKITTAITKRYSLVAVENLNTKGMMKNHNLAKSISDCSWGEFINKLMYKGIWYGCEIIKIGRFEPSSKMCSSCGCVMDNMPLSVREWTCPHCGTHHDRDLNAAKNILNFALSGRQEELGKLPTMVGALNQENLGVAIC